MTKHIIRLGKAKLDIPQVRSIKESLAHDASKEAIEALAKQYGVAYNTIWRINANQTWRFVTI